MTKRLDSLEFRYRHTVQLIRAAMMVIADGPMRQPARWCPSTGQWYTPRRRRTGKHAGNVYYREAPRHIPSVAEEIAWRLTQRSLRGNTRAMMAWWDLMEPLPSQAEIREAVQMGKWRMGGFPGSGGHIERAPEPEPVELEDGSVECRDRIITPRKPHRSTVIEPADPEPVDVAEDQDAGEPWGSGATLARCCGEPDPTE